LAFSIGPRRFSPKRRFTIAHNVYERRPNQPLELKTIAVTFRSGDLDGVRYKCMRFWFGAERSKAFGEHPEVMFYFYDEKYHHRGFQRKISADAWKVEDPSLGDGVESVLSPPRK
jgi:hypothetical protein